MRIKNVAVAAAAAVSLSCTALAVVPAQAAPAASEPVAPVGATLQTLPLAAQSGDVNAAVSAALKAHAKYATVNSIGVQQGAVSPSAVTAAGESAICKADKIPGRLLEERFEACGNAPGRLQIIEVRTRKVLGAMNYTVHLSVLTSRGSKEWTYQLFFHEDSAWGLAKGSEISGKGLCSNGCSLAGRGLPPQPLGPSGKAEADWTVTGRVGKGAKVLGSATAAWLFITPGATPSNTVKLSTPQIRCDNAYKGNRPAYGCVLPDVVPVLQYSLSGPWPELAKHIQDAQNSGLPGKYGTSSYLTRMYDDKLIVKNRGVACPDSLPRPTGQSCDEYPFASTYQGAFMSGGKYSRRMINDKQNEDGGKALNSFYLYNRILNNDRFQVYITR